MSIMKEELTLEEALEIAEMAEHWLVRESRGGNSEISYTGMAEVARVRVSKTLNFNRDFDDSRPASEKYNLQIYVISAGRVLFDQKGIYHPEIRQLFESIKEMDASRRYEGEVRKTELSYLKGLLSRNPLPVSTLPKTK